MLVAVLAGVGAAAFVVLSYFSTRHAQDTQKQQNAIEAQNRADQRIRDLENANTFATQFVTVLQKNQECMITLLLMTPETRVRLTDDELALICPPVPRLQIGPSASSGSSSGSSTTTTSSPTTTTVPTPTTAPPPPPPPEPCLTLPVLGCAT